MLEELTNEGLKAYTRQRYDQIDALKVEIKAANDLLAERERQEQIQRKVESLPDDVKNAIIKANPAGAGGSDA